VNHWEALEHEPDPSPETLALLELREQSQILAAAVERLQGGSQPAPETDDQRLAYLTSWLRGYIGPWSLTANGAEGLAREMLANRILAKALAPMEWPELPREVPEYLLPDNQRHAALALLVWEHARSTLAEMNPNRQGDVSRG
jgi:hypothetical protein